MKTGAKEQVEANNMVATHEDNIPASEEEKNKS